MTIRLHTASLLLAALAAPSAWAEAPAIEHQRVGCIVAGKYPRMDACFLPEAVVQARVYFRAEGTAPWFYVEMQPERAVSAKAGCLSGALPRPSRKLVGKHVEYYVEASDAAFNPGRTPEYAPRVVRYARDCEKDAPAAPLSGDAPAAVFPAMPAGFSSGGGLGSVAVLGGLLGAGAVAGGAVALTNDDEEQQHALQVARTGSGTGTVSSAPAGISCGATCGASYPAGTEVRLTATADPGSSFTGWEGACSGTGDCVVTMDAPRSVTARFGRRVALTVLREGNGAGGVTSAPAGIDCGASCTATFEAGASVVLSAQAAPGSSFAGWSGGGCSGTAPCTVVMDTARTVTATFTAGIVRLTVVKEGNGTGRVVSSPPGLDCGPTCTAAFALRTEVTLTATADPGSVFVGWTGGGCSGTGTCTVTMDSAKAVTATFSGQMRLTLTVTGTGSGTVTSSPAGINCSIGNVGACAANYAAGTLVELTASAPAGTVFSGWGGDCAGTSGNQCVVTMDAARSVSATFGLLKKKLTVLKAGAGSGTVTSAPAGINCGPTCAADYDPGTTVTLTAVPDATSVFTGWSGGGCSGTGPCTVVMNADITVTATFDARKTLTVLKAGAGGGTVTSVPAGINCGATCSAQYNPGTTVTLTAAPDTASIFTGWSGGGCSGTGACTVVMNADTTVTATFQPATFDLTVTVDGPGSVSDDRGQIVNCTTTCTASYPNGVTVTLTVFVTGDGAAFMGWSGACTGTGACTVVMTQNRAVTATIGWPLDVTKAGSGSGTVTSNPPGINCGADCNEVYRQGTSVTLTATAAAGSTFAGWSGACTGTGPCTVLMTDARFVTATFEAQRTLTVTVLIGSFGTGGTVRSSSTPPQPGEPRIVCTAPPSPTVCTTTYANGIGVTLTATTSDLVRWTGCTGTAGNVCTLTMDADRAVTAEFFSIGAQREKAGLGDTTPSGPGTTWVSVLEAPAATGQLLFNGSQTAFAGSGVTRVTVSPRSGENRVEARLQSASGQPGTWRFELQSRDAVEPGSLRVLQGEPVLVLPDAVVFRLSGRVGEQVGFTYRVKP